MSALSEIAALFGRLMKIHSNPPILLYYEYNDKFYITFSMSS